MVWALAFIAALPLLANSDSTFKRLIQPFIAKNCTLCHNAKARTAGLNLEDVKPEDDDVWDMVLAKLRAGEMPPAGRPKLSPAELHPVIAWIEDLLRRADAAAANPGRVTARRLNRYEYNNTIRDLLGVEFRPADDFPADDSGYGFDNNGDVLSLSPVLMEKYLAAAEQISRAAVAADPLPKPTIERYKAEQLSASGNKLRVRHRFRAAGEYELRVGLGGIRPEGAPAVNLALLVDGNERRLFAVDPSRNKKRSFDLRLPLTAGDHDIEAAFVDDHFKAKEVTLDRRDRLLAIDFIEIRGPFPADPPIVPESRKRIFICGHEAGRHQPDCARRIVSGLARRAWRRPVTTAETTRLLRFVAIARKEGDSFEQGIRLALQAILVSPEFLFRVEHDSGPDAHPVSDFELASRLSYFLWGSMPDDELLRVAESRTLAQPARFYMQVTRMLRDPKIDRFVENFAEQWLQLRNLEEVKPDPDRFPDFDDELRDAMRQETLLFFRAMVHEDRSVLDFLDAQFTFLNERLARHYGIPGVEGREFRRVELTGGRRSGVLTQASILTISSYPTRTSPVLRGRWLLDNILGAPPPPPPPDVPELDEKAIGATASMRQQLEQHRANAACAACHAKMDPLGFALENYDAIGQWRTRDGNFPIDAAATLPGGKSFQGAAEMKAILKADPGPFVQCLAEKMLTYALGRGLENYDKRAVKLICRRLPANRHRFSALTWEIVNSPPFRMRRSPLAARHDAVTDGNYAGRSATADRVAGVLESDIVTARPNR